MALIKRIQNKLERTRYKLLEKQILRELDLGTILDPSRKHIFLYFDYEREFSGHETGITDSDVEAIVKLLSQNQLVSTWFTVGKVLMKYPETIRLIQAYGNEIGSHTFSHLALRKATARRINEDFMAYASLDNKDMNIKGFHSPKDQWDTRAFACYTRYGYQYDMLKTGFIKNPKTFRLRYRGLESFIRFSSVLDDWDLYRRGMEASDVNRYFAQVLDYVSEGHIAGIGFHPWILVSDQKIWDGFAGFVSFLASAKDVVIHTCGQYADFLNRNI